MVGANRVPALEKGELEKRSNEVQDREEAEQVKKPEDDMLCKREMPLP